MFHTQWIAHALVLFCLNHAQVEGAAIIENQTATWAAAGMANSLVRSTDNILPPHLFEAVSREALLFQAHEAEERRKRTASGGYAHGKGGTFWFPLFKKNGERTRPRFAIEAAIQMIFDSDFSGSIPERVTGGEWWVQHRDAKEDIIFHHDKDEGMASLKSTMRFPECGTVTYLTDNGGPTLLFNQTTPDGNRDVPVIPHEGALSYPFRNRHLIFRGNLQHGVVGDLAINTQSGMQLRSPDKRTTFLINWWVEKPMSPNCEVMPTKTAKLLGLYDKEGMTAMVERYRANPHKPTPVPVDELVVPKRREDRWTNVVQLAGHDSLWYDLPQDLSKGLWSIHWRPGQIFGNTARLDLQKGVQWIFGEPRAKLIAFLRPGREEEAALPFLLKIAKEHQDRIKLVLADPTATGDAMGFFGLTPADAPTVGIHVTHPSTKKYLLPRSGARRSGHLSREAVMDMVEAFLAGRLPPMEDQL